MTRGEWVALGLSAALVVATGVLAMAEAALARASRIRALAWAEEGRRGAARLARLLEHPERPLAVLALVVLVGRVVAAALVGVVGWRRGGDAGAVVAVVVLLAGVVLVGEIGPRRLALRRVDGTALRLAGVAAALSRLGPLAGAARAMAAVPWRARLNGNGPEEEVMAGDAEGGDEELDAEERQLIHSIFEFGDTIVREVMVPRTDMVAIEAATTVDDALDAAIAAGFSRLPVYRERLDDIVGLAYVKDLVRAARQGHGRAPVSTTVRKAVFVPEQKRVAELLREMQQRKFHMAMVVDEYGGTAGLVTLEDLLEEIVGEIVDEYDVEEPHVEELGDGALRVAGRTPVDEVNELLGLELPDEEWDTVGGLIFDLVGHVPEEGEVVSFQGIEFQVERVQGRRILSVQVRRLSRSDNGEMAPADGQRHPPA